MNIKPLEGNSSSAKVEGGTRFKLVWRHTGVYQRTGVGKASSCCKSKERSRKWIDGVKTKESPETPTPDRFRLVTSSRDWAKSLWSGRKIQSHRRRSIATL